MIRHELHPGMLRRSDEAIDDGLRRIADRENAAVAFGLEFHAARFEPRHSIARRETLERANQLALAARKPARKLPRIETGMRHVAAPAAGDADFAEELPAFLQQCHLRTGFGGSDGGEESGRATANNDNPRGTHARWRVASSCRDRKSTRLNSSHVSESRMPS